MSSGDEAQTPQEGSAWESFRALSRRRKVMVILGAPLWLPIALAAWLDD